MKYITKKEQSFCRTISFAAGLIGRASLILFVVFLYHGPFSIFHLGFQEPVVSLFNTVLSILFFLQHSLLVRRTFRNKYLRKLPSHFHDAFYSITAGLLLLFLTLFWQQSETIIIQLDGLLSLILRGFFMLGIGGLIWGITALNFFDPFGQRPIRNHIKNRKARSQVFTIKGPYLFVRHPLYFFVLVLFWTSPSITLDRLFLNTIWTIWIYIGTVLEEKDLVSDFGNKYIEYQKKVPMLIPWKLSKTR